MKKWLIVFFLVLLVVGAVSAQTTTSTTLRFAWESNTETDLDGYGLYSGSVEGTYDVHIDLDIPVSPTAEVNYEASNILVNVNEPTYFVVDAFDTAGNRSGFSNVVSYIHCVPEPEQTQSIACGTGYTGTKIQKRVSSCSFNSMPVWGNWIDVSNTCVAQTICKTSTETRDAGACGTGYTGNVVERRTSTCASTYATPVWGAWIADRSACVALTACKPLADRVETASCGEGYSGSIITTTKSTCPDPYGQPVWGNPTTVNTCTALTLCVAPAPESRTLSCPSGQTGSIIETRSSSCPDKYGTPVIGPWTQTSNTCKVVSTCVPVTTTKTTRCLKWYEKGSITQQSTSICQEDGTSIPGPWTVISSTCRPWWKK